MPVSDCRIIVLPQHHDVIRGNLTFIEGNQNVPFEIKRVYYMYDIPSGETRGGHVHKKLRQVLIAVSGSFNVMVDDGTTRMEYFMNHPQFGLYVPNMIWRDIYRFSSSATCLVLASEHFDESDYCRSYADFLKVIRECKSPS